MAAIQPAPDSPPDAVIDIDRGATDHPDRVVSAARYYLTHDLDGFRDDCSGFVSAVMTRAGLPMELGALGLWEAASGAGAVHHRKIPRVGDVAFFDNTYDKNKDRKPNDIATHVAVVIGVADDGTITMAHGGSSNGRTTLTMNLLRPHDRRAEDGTELNDYLRVRKDSDPPGLDYLAGELWRGFATVREVDLADWLTAS